MLEGQKFPRFSIGESLLAHCLDFVAEAGMIEAVDAAGFQFKNGAAFIRGDEYGDFDFGDKFTPGRNSTYQVQRAAFDKLLADEAEKQGVEIRYETRVVAVDNAAAAPRVSAKDAAGREYTVQGRFILDASGFARTLPRLLDLEIALDVPGAQRRLHACGGSRSRRRIRSQQDPGRRSPRASRRVVLADSVPERPLLARVRCA